MSECGSSESGESSKAAAKGEGVVETYEGSFEPHVGGMGVLLGASFIVAEIAGAGLLNLPSAISSCGEWVITVLGRGVFGYDFV